MPAAFDLAYNILGIDKMNINDDESSTARDQTGASKLTGTSTSDAPDSVSQRQNVEIRGEEYAGSAPVGDEDRDEETKPLLDLTDEEDETSPVFLANRAKRLREVCKQHHRNLRHLLKLVKALDVFLDAQTQNSLNTVERFLKRYPDYAAGIFNGALPYGEGGSDSDGEN